MAALCVLCNSTPPSMHGKTTQERFTGKKKKTKYQASIHIGSLQMLEETDTR
jgi:hypothetical protein